LQGKRIFIVGPPGSNVRELTLQLSTHFQTDVVLVGDLLKKEISKKTEIGEKIDEYIKNMLYVPDEIVFSVLKAHMDSVKRESNIIVEGFPKTPYQSMALIRAGIIPDLFVLVNHTEEKCKEYARSKFNESDNEFWAEVSETDRSERSLEYLSQYQMYFS
jgi:adenylate kinase